MAVGCGAQCAKVILIVFNIVFWLSGAALLGLGIWMFVDDDISNYIKVFQAFDDGGSFIRYSAIVIICVGCFVLLVGFLGCCGAIKENRCMLGMYITFLVIVMGAEITAGVLAIIFRDEYIFCLVIVILAGVAIGVFAFFFKNKYIFCLVCVMAAEVTAAVFAIIFKDKVTDELQKELEAQITKRYGDLEDDTSEAFTEGLDYIQEELECCGVKDPSMDFKESPYWVNNGHLPTSCCKSVPTGGVCTDYFTKGCFDEIEDWVEDNSTILIIVGFVVAGIEIFGFIFAVCLCRNVGEED